MAKSDIGILYQRLAFVTHQPADHWRAVDAYAIYLEVGDAGAFRILLDCFELFRIVFELFRIVRIPTHAVGHALQRRAATTRSRASCATGRTRRSAPG